VNKLKLDDLSVESFATSAQPASLPGTVHARQEWEERPSQDAYCSTTQPALQCGHTACESCRTYGYTCGFETCFYNCQTKSLCGGDTGTETGGTECLQTVEGTPGTDPMAAY
jgi:hypothetical protein